MKALVGAFNQEKALVGAFSVIVQPVVEPMDSFTALAKTLLQTTKKRFVAANDHCSWAGMICTTTTPTRRPAFREELAYQFLRFNNNQCDVKLNRRSI